MNPRINRSTYVSLHVSEQARIALHFYDCKVWAQVKFLTDTQDLIASYLRDAYPRR